MVNTVTVGVVALAATLATAVFVGGSPTVPPPPIKTPVPDAAILPGYISQVVRWQPSPGATGYRIYLNSVVISTMPAKFNGATLSLPCGVPHKINVQPVNNKGLAPLAPPLFVTPLCLVP